MILISYPSGGFGNFIFHVLTECADNTYKPDNKSFQFDLNGNSHATKKYTPVFFHDNPNYKIQLPETNKESLILCDNGINNDEYVLVNKIFNNPTIIRMVIDEPVRPVIYKTCVIKAQKSRLIDESLSRVLANWGTQEDYAIRENFTLLYHNWPFKWDSKPGCINVSIAKLIANPSETLTDLIANINGTVLDVRQLTDLCGKWADANKLYFSILTEWQNIESALNNGTNYKLNVADLHDQGYINYCIERKYNITIPVFDYKDWFVDTNHIRTLL